MKSRFWQRPLRAALAAALLGSSSAASAAGYSVVYNPYADVDWASTLRCQSEHHDHAYDAPKITALSNAGYCAVTFMTYSGDYRPQPPATWIANGSPNPDPGVATGWGEYRRWPPESYGAPALPLNSLRFYLPGAEEVGLVGGTPGHQVHTAHMLALGLSEYIEGVGCDSCGNDGSAVHNDNPFALPESHRYSSESDFVAKVVALGAIPVLAHPNGPPTQYDFISPYPKAVEMYNNYHALFDDGTAAQVPGCLSGPSNLIGQMRAVWDHVLLTKSPRIWGIAVNDWGSAWTPLGISSTPCWAEITPTNRDRGKTQVLLPSYDLQSYLQAFAAGAFFAVVENNAVKAAYPTVTGINVTYNSISITTADGDETVTWIGNGQVVAAGFTLDLSNLPADLVYARAEIDDGEGRVVYTQPFSLGDPVPPPPDAPVPSLSEEAAALLGLALLLIVLWKAPSSTARA